jgi:hypothetical protein
MKFINFFHNFSLNFYLNPTVEMLRQNIYMQYVPKHQLYIRRSSCHAHVYINKYVFVNILQNSLTVDQVTITMMTQQDSSIPLTPNSANGRDSQPIPHTCQTQNSITQDLLYVCLPLIFLFLNKTDYE